MEIYQQLISDRIDNYMLRICGEIVCPICGTEYKYHPLDKEVLLFWPGFELHMLCEGILGKT